MNKRLAKNIEYSQFLTSVNDNDDDVSCNKLEIPEFQRNYVWKASNIKDLFDSINENDCNYYLGNIVVVKDGRGRSKIVDGQQRLVSLSIIAKQLLKRTTDINKKQNLKKIIWADEGDMVFRILFKKNNLHNLYSDIMCDKAFNGSDLDDSQNILFKSSEAVIKECDSLEDIDNFIDKFLSLEFVVIVSPSDEDAYQLFEGLNSTGLSLSAVELTKNSILGKVKTLDNSKVSYAIELWNEIEKSFEDTNIAWFNKFLRHHWFSLYGYINNGDLFRNIKSNLINKSGVSAGDLIDYLYELKKDSSIYISFRTSNLNKVDFNLSMHEEAWINIEKINSYIKQLGLDQIYSVLLSFYKYGKGQSDYFKRGETFKRHMKRIWCFLLIVKYTKVSPSAFERDFANICKNMQGKSYNEFKSIIDTFFKNISEKIKGLEEDFSVTLNESIDYSVDDRGMIRFILEEYLIASGNGSDSDIETEHIVPESTLVEWNNVKDKDTLSLAVGKLGNLTLLNKTLNNDAKHKSFNEKFTIAYSKSKFTENNNLMRDWGKQFNSENPLTDAINLRGKFIGSVVYNKYVEELID